MVAPPVVSTPRYSLLCVDDEPQMLKALALNLGAHYAVELAPNGRVALQMLKAMPNINVIISDMRMPGMNGAQFLAAARQIAPRVRRLVLTGDTGIQTAQAAVNEGRVFRYLTKPCSSTLLLEAVAAAIEDFNAEARESSAIRKTIIHDALMHDSTTALESRESLLERLNGTYSSDGSDELTDRVLLFIDIDIDEELAEASDISITDQAMRILAGRLQALIQDAQCLARYRQTTFVALLAPHASSIEDALALAANLVSSLEEPVLIRDTVLIHSLRIGIATVPCGTKPQHIVLRHAEVAARHARTQTTSAVCVFSQELSTNESRRRDLSRALTLAVGREQLTLYYQPIVDVNTHSVYTIEALARWVHPQLGTISPDVFIPLAEESGLIIQFGDWALNRACTEALTLPRALIPRVSVNVSVAQLVHPRFLARMSESLERSTLPPSALEIEVTETFCALDLDKACAVLSEVRLLGIRVAIDDFGAGYSSLSYLNRLPADVLKIDASFARNIDRGGEFIIVAALGVADKLGIDVILEGIESERTMMQARALGISKMQGFYFARPRLADDLLPWHREFIGPVREQIMRSCQQSLTDYVTQ